MDFNKVLNELQSINPEINDSDNPRRSMLKNFTGFGGKIAIAALPLGLSAVLEKVSAAGTLSDTVADVLNVALTLEYLETSYYTLGINTPGLIPADVLPGYRQILADDNHHLAFLQGILGAQAKPAPTFDYAGGGGIYIGPFTSAFTYYSGFIELAQAFKDIGLRIYQGLFPTFIGQKDMLTALFDIHSVESRHSAHIHQLSYKNNDYPVRPWIVSSDYRNGLNHPVLYPVYTDEENSIQLGVSANSSAYDEPMQPVDAKKILNTFIKTPHLI